MTTSWETGFTDAAELRFADDAGVFEGYGARWDVRDTFGDIWTRGVFAETLAAHAARGSKPLLLWQHNPAEPIGTWDEIREDDTGLFVRGRLILEVRRAQEAKALVSAGAISGLSPGFRTVKAEKRADGGRTLRAVDLIELSIVSRPAIRGAGITQLRGESSPSSAAVAAAIRGAAATIKGA